MIKQTNDVLLKNSYLLDAAAASDDQLAGNTMPVLNEGKLSKANTHSAHEKKEQDHEGKDQDRCLNWALGKENLSKHLAQSVSLVGRTKEEKLAIDVQVGSRALLQQVTNILVDFAVSSQHGLCSNCS